MTTLMNKIQGEPEHKVWIELPRFTTHEKAVEDCAMLNIYIHGTDIGAFAFTNENGIYHYDGQPLMENGRWFDLEWLIGIKGQ